MHPAYKKNVAPRRGGAALLVIDPQVDFHTGSLGIESATKDAERIASFINTTELEEIYVTLDSHQRFHIAHAAFWKNKAGAHPKPFTTISLADLRASRWSPVHSIHHDWCDHYLKSLENGKMQLIIWPDHCLVGSQGACVQSDIQKALGEWEVRTGRTVNYIMKGCNSLTEHYSAIRAEVPHPNDPSTELNMDLVDNLKKHDAVFICGQALSHCVGLTVSDLANNWDSSSLERLILLTNCTSSVKGFESQGERFLETFRKQGIRTEQANEVRSRCFPFLGR